MIITTTKRMENKMTALESFIEQLPIRIINSYQKEIEKAIQMEKQQIKTAFNDGEQNVWDRQHSAFEFEFDDSDDYYNKTFNKAK